MSISVLRTNDNSWWVGTVGGYARVDTTAVTTAELVQERAAIAAAAESAASPLSEDLTVVSPVTAPCRIVAQMTNFVSHVRDVGDDPDSVPLTFFRKSSGSITGPYGDVVRPAHVGLLDYEVEIGLVFGRDMPVGSVITSDNLGDYVGGLVVTNDVSARDVQLLKTQFYEAKSYPTFTPVGPVLVLLDSDELKRLSDLRLRLWVNGELRQDMTAADMIYPPLEALWELTRFQRMNSGDLLLTGTPVGTALSAPPRPVRAIASLLPTTLKWNLFFKGQRKNSKYLRAGDVIESTIGTDDGVIQLGRQRLVVRDAG